MKVKKIALTIVLTTAISTHQKSKTEKVDTNVQKKIDQVKSNIKTGQILIATWCEKGGDSPQDA